MTRNDIAEILNTIPQLTDHGIGIFNHGRGLSPEQIEDEFAKQREDLLQSVEDCNQVCDWLMTLEKIATINYKHSSYGLKHIFERVTGKYVTNGVFIVAAIHSGFPYKIQEGSPNVYFGISERSINALE